MGSNTLTFEYRFRGVAPEVPEASFELVLDAKTLEQIHEQQNGYPDWARLDCEQCEDCPLSPEQHTYCPAALSIADLVAHFNEALSFHDVEVTVKTAERTVTGRTTIQKALSSLVGLCMATSGCPRLAKFRPMARFHLPLATLDETVFRSVGAYLLAQYFLKRRGKPFDMDLEGLRDIYQPVHEVNVALAKRLRRVAVGDANVNALIVLDLFAQQLPFSIESNLDHIEHLFAPFLDKPA